MATKKILIFNTAQVVDLIGGSQASLEDAITHFLDNNIQVTYISYRFNPIINYNGPNFKRIFINRFRLNPIKFSLDILLVFSQILFKKFDYVWANSALPSFIFIPFIYSRVNIYTFHGPIIEEQVYANKTKIKIYVTKYFYKIFLNYFHHLHYNTNYVKFAVENEYRFTKNYQSTTSEVLVDEKIFKDKFSNFKKFNQYGDKLTILIPRRLVKRTGVSNFINLIKVLPTYLQDNFIFLISGDGPEKENVVNLISHSKNIFYLGLLTEQQLNLMLYISDVVCIPSIAAEGFCLPARQAMILDKFILHSGQGGLIETTDNYYKSMIFNYTEKNSLSEQLSNIKNFDEETKYNYKFISYEYKLKNLFKNLYE